MISNILYPRTANVDGLGAMEGGNKSLSLPFMDLDDLPGGLGDVDDMYLGTYLNGVKGACS